jgi:hypothetical protein
LSAPGALADGDAVGKLADGEAAGNGEGLDDDDVTTAVALEPPLPPHAPRIDAVQRPRTTART